LVPGLELLHSVKTLKQAVKDEKAIVAAKRAIFHAKLNVTKTLKSIEKNRIIASLSKTPRVLDDVCQNLLKAVRDLQPMEGFLKEEKQVCTDDFHQYESKITRAKELVTTQMVYLDS
jgi:hypothetical protein